MDQNATTDNQWRICVIDDDVEVLEQAQRIFGAQGLEVLVIAHTVGSTNEIRNFDPHVIVLDIKMPAINGEKLLALLRHALTKMPPVIFYSGIDPDELKRLAAHHQAADYSYKGDGMMNLLSKVNRQIFGREKFEKHPGQNGASAS